MPRILLHCLFVLTVSESAASPLTVLIVAGQSNILNWHATAAALPADPVDGEILFYHATGAPPSRGFAVPVNASSAGQWERLGAQTQEPFIRYEKVFFGPEISLARRLHHRGVGALAAIKIGYFGTNLAEDWRPAAPSGNRLYATMQREIARALGELRETGRPFRLGGFFWMQGETDASQPAHAAAYAENLRQFIAALRHDLAVPALPFIVGRIGPQPPRGYSHQASVRQAQVTVIESASAAGWTDTDDLPRGTDGIHLLAAGVITLGERWADAWQKQRGSR